MTVETAPARAAELFGHPKGLTVLFATEMWERFSYYGMRALLVLYMVKHLLQPGQAETVSKQPGSVLAHVTEEPRPRGICAGQ